MDNSLRHPVARSSLATEDGDTWSKLLPLLWGHLLDGEVSVNDSEDVELLSLVFMYTLDLNVEERLGVDADTSSLQDVLGKSDLVGILNLCPLLLELLVIDKVLKLVEKGQVLQELVAAKLGGDELRESWVSLVQPSSWCDTVGDICELVWSVDLDKVLENGSLDQVGVKLSNTVDLVRANDCKVGHSYHLWLRFLDDGNSAEHVTILGKSSFDLLQEVQIDIINDLISLLVTFSHTRYVKKSEATDL